LADRVPLCIGRGAKTEAALGEYDGGLRYDGSQVYAPEAALWG
jgi:hypothetical protein